MLRLPGAIWSVSFFSTTANGRTPVQVRSDIGDVQSFCHEDVIRRLRVAICEGAEAISKLKFALAMMTAVVLLSLFSPPALAAKRVALVIGNASYDHAPTLTNPLNDATDVGDAMGRLGFEVIRIQNADYEELRRSLLAFTDAASRSELAVVYYAGHGIEVGGKNYLVPVDAKLSNVRKVALQTVSLELVSEAVGGASGLRLIILDACRDNPFAAAMQRAGTTRSISQRGLGQVEPSGETLVAYAAKHGEVALDGTGRNSPYAEALLAHLEVPGLEVGKMFRKVRDTVLESTGQQQMPFTYGSLPGDDLFLGPRPEPTSSAGPGAVTETPVSGPAAGKRWAGARAGRGAGRTRQPSGFTRSRPTSWSRSVSRRASTRRWRWSRSRSLPI